MAKPDVEEMRQLAARLVTQLPAASKERQYAVMIAEKRIPERYTLLQFRRVAIFVRDSKSHRISKPVRHDVMAWLARWGGNLRVEEVRGAHRLEMRLTVDEYAAINKAATSASLSMADYARRAVLALAERA